MHVCVCIYENVWENMFPMRLLINRLIKNEALAQSQKKINGQRFNIKIFNNFSLKMFLNNIKSRVGC